MTVCGRLHDVETGEPLVTTDPETIDRCPLDGSGGGVCAIELKYYDAVAFVTDPSTSPIQTDETQTEEGGGPGDGITYIDNCGRFKASNIVPPQLGFLAIGADDHDALAADDYKTTGIAMPASSNRFVTGVNAYITRVSTDNGWTTSAGDPFNGQSFAEKGVYLPIFINPADPEPGRVSGVQVTTKGSTQPDDTYYFADPDAIISEVDETATSTGPNGAALMVNVGLSAKSGTGALPAACAWPDDQGAAVEAVVFVQERHAEDANDENMECMEPSP